MLKNTLIICLVIVIIYLYYQNIQKPNFKNSTSELTSFLQTSLNSNSLQELKTKLGEKSLNEILEEKEDYETEVDTLTRTKNSLEQDLTAQSNAYNSRLREKDREIKKLKEDLKALEKVRENLTSEKQQHKGSLERIKLLTEQITSLEKQLKKMPGEFPTERKAK
jgi:chromosome segregation ATPase